MYEESVSGSACEASQDGGKQKQATRKGEVAIVAQPARESENEVAA